MIERDRFLLLGLLSAADPLGRTVLVCQRGPDGALGPTIGIAVADGILTLVVP